MMKLKKLIQLSLLNRLSEKSGNYKIADRISNKLIKLAQNAEETPQFTQGTELQTGQMYEVPTTDHSVFDKVAQTGVPDYANVGGEKVLVTHGSSDGMWLVPDTVMQQFLNNNPEFKETGQVGEADQGAGIVAAYETSKDRFWLNAAGMKKYVNEKWVGCYDYKTGGKSSGAYGGSKGPIEVITQTGPEGQKTYLQAGN